MFFVIKMLKMLNRVFSITLTLSLIFFMAPQSLADEASYGAITGRVLDRNGMPLANATVDARNWAGYVVCSTVSGPDGTFTLDKIPITGVDGRNTFSLLATYNASGKTYTDKTIFFWVYKNQVVEHDVVIYYYPPSGYGWLTGKVVNASDLKQYLPATIYLNNGMYYFVSGEPGDSFQFYLPEGDYQVWAEHSENGQTYSSGKSDVHVKGDDTLTSILMISLNGNGTPYHAPPAPGVNVVHGIVKQRNDAPLYGATVELCRMTGKSFPVMSTTTNVDGYYVFNGVNISSPMENFVVRLLYDYNGSKYVKLSNPFTVYYNNMLNVTHDYNVPLSVEFVDSGSLELITDPPGAHIWIDGMDTGRVTPFNFTGIKVGYHSCSLIMDGYLPENLSIRVPAEGTAKATKVLKPSTGDVYFMVKPADALVYVNGEPVGKGSINLTRLQYGEYAYTVCRDGYRNATGTFEVLPGRDLTVKVELVAVPGLSLTYLGYLIDGIINALSSIF
ncbi:PEGA domain protein [Methanocella conradii HZ254]|uniref:PEGA domain protein n=1 Tax=Methanocella conradii (strain DSM 24694 / JCM 17849 / CGMCC 1.5162 / HZ254) TaxID=1041930 RepID=H8I5U4_METCZ|nr:PEGA domain protein [Methanocella conradii HZ254]